MNGKRLLAALACSSFLASAAPAGAAPRPLDARIIVERILARNPSLRSFQAHLHVNIRMLNFPFFAPELDGTSYFKRPDNYEVVFDRVPPYAKGFAKMFDAIGDPAAWEADQNVTYAGQSSLGGRPMLELRMTKKVYSSILDYTLAYVDPSDYQVTRMEWHYRNGGTIVMTQSFKTEGAYSVIASQHATIDIPHIRAVADAIYGTYHTNVAVDSAVFSKQ